MLVLDPKCLGKFPAGRYDVLIWLCAQVTSTSAAGRLECHPYLVDGFEVYNDTRSFDLICTGPEQEQEHEYEDLQIQTSHGLMPARACIPKVNGEYYKDPHAFFLFTHGMPGQVQTPEQYERYDYLLHHLAENGFLAVSVSSAISGANPATRADVLVDGIQKVRDVLRANFNYEFEAPVVLAGHSQGGQAAALAAQGQDSVKAVVALGPTNTDEDDPAFNVELGPEQAYLGLYGTFDGDQDQRFPLAQFERISGGRDRGYLMLRRCTHGGFTNVDVISGMTDYKLGLENGHAWYYDVLDPAVQRDVVQHTVAAFLKWRFHGDEMVGDMFLGGYPPFAVLMASLKDTENGERKLDIYPRFVASDSRVLFDVDRPEAARLDDPPPGFKEPKGVLSDIVNPAVDLPGVQPCPHNKTYGLRITWDPTDPYFGYRDIVVSIDLPHQLSDLIQTVYDDYQIAIELGLVAGSPLNEPGPGVPDAHLEPWLGFGDGTLGLKDPHAWLAPHSGTLGTPGAPYVEQVGNTHLERSRLRTVVYRLKDLAWKLTPDEDPDFFNGVNRLFLKLSAENRYRMDVLVGHAYLAKR